MLGSGAGLFLFCRRPTAIYQQAVLSKHVLDHHLHSPQLSHQTKFFNFVSELVFQDGRAGR